MSEPSRTRRIERATTIADLDAVVVSCRACPRLVRWREKVAREKRAAFRDEEYWGRPVPGFGPADASILIVGLAPAAHGANRTGRMFTGDRSGDVLFAALHAVGLATQAEATGVDDGLALIGTRVSAPVRCAPPQNKPTPSERRNCAPFLRRELELLGGSLEAIVVLGSFGWQALLASLAESGWAVPRPRPRFGHGARIELTHPDGRRVTVLGCYHVSQHNTFTGRLTPTMLEQVLTEARATMTNAHEVRVRRIYEDSEVADGERVLVDRLWPRGMGKERAELSVWLKEVAPSPELRRWYGHDPAKFAEFEHRYRAELEAAEPATAFAELRTLAGRGTVTLLTASRQTEISHAEVLRRLLA